MTGEIQFPNLIVGPGRDSQSGATVTVSTDLGNTHTCSCHTHTHTHGGRRGGSLQKNTCEDQVGNFMSDYVLLKISAEMKISVEVVKFG